MKIRSHRELVAWQKAMTAATDVYSAARLMSRDDRYVLGSQLQRAALSVPSNIAEGWGHGRPRVLAKHLRIALGSSLELQTQLELSGRVNAIPADLCGDLLARSEEVARILHGLLRSVEREATASSR
jgi:four helix bundle protein